MLDEGFDKLVETDIEVLRLDHELLDFILEQGGALLWGNLGHFGYSGAESRTNFKQALAREFGHYLVRRVGIDLQPLA